MERLPLPGSRDLWPQGLVSAVAKQLPPHHERPLLPPHPPSPPCAGAARGGKVGRAGRGVPRGVSAAVRAAACLQAVLSLPFQAPRATALNTITKVLMTAFKRQFTKRRQFFLSSPLVSGHHPASKHSEPSPAVSYSQRLNPARGIHSTTSSCLPPAERCPLSPQAGSPYAPGTE